MAINQTPDIHEFIVCANVFVKKGDQYLLLKRSPQKRFAPNVVHPVGGKCDLNENPYLAAKREVFEETGLQIDNLKLEAVILEIIPHKDLPYNWLIFHFSADYLSGEITTTEEGELLWLKKDELKDVLKFPSVARLIDHILDPNDGTVFATFEYDEAGQIVKGTERVDVCPVH